MLLIVSDTHMVPSITMLRCDSLNRHKNVDFFMILWKSCLSRCAQSGRIEDVHSSFAVDWLMRESECCGGGGGDFALDFIGNLLFWWVFCQNLIDLISMGHFLVCY